MRKSLFLIVSAAVCASTNIHAQQLPGFITQKVKQCETRIGPDILTFTFYQPFRSREQFCDEIPDIGQTTIVIDSMQDELREMNIEIRLFRDTRGDGKYDARNLESTAPLTHFTGGTIKYDYNFSKPGNYFASVRAVSLDGRKEYNADFYFNVGQSSWYWMLSTATATIAAFLLALAFYWARLHRGTAGGSRLR